MTHVDEIDAKRWAVLIEVDIKKEKFVLLGDNLYGSQIGFILVMFLGQE